MLFLYARVSAVDGSQNVDRQLIDKEKYDEVFIDYASGSSMNRPKLQELLKWCRKGDIIEVNSIDRLARNIDDLLKILNIITVERQADLHFIKENLDFQGGENANPMTKLILSIMGIIAEFERQIIKERQMEGIRLAQAKGVYNKKRSLKLDNEKIKAIKNDILNCKVPLSIVARKYNITRATCYKYLKI